jgi:hypothetical protein
MRLETTTTVNSQGQVDSVNLVVGVQKAAMSSFGGDVKTTEDFKKQVQSNNGEEMTADEKAMYDACAYTESDTEFVMTCNLNQDQYTKLMAQQKDSGATADAGNGLGTFSLEGDTIKGTIPTTKTEPAAAAAGLTSTATVIFPGEIQTVAGAGATKDANDGKILRIDNLKTDGGDVTVTASTGSSSNTILYVAAGAMFIILLLMGVGALLYSQTRGKNDSVDSAPVVADAEAPVDPTPAAEEAAPADDIITPTEE